MNRNSDSEPWKRFEREAKIQRELTEERFAGVLPVVAFEIPTRGTPARAWLAMPIAVNAEDIFGAAPDLHSVVEALASIAKTLARLHARGIAHRDVKPQNIYQSGTEWLVGDFGLIEVPDAESLTKGPTGPGSLHYIAPELMQDPDAPGDAADVWSFAKTLWVLSTGQRYPLPGELRVDVDGLRLSSYSKNRRSPLLDMLIEACTRFDPKRRPSMQDVADDLADWLNPTIATSAEMPDLATIGREIAAKAAADEHLVARESRHEGEMRLAVARMVELVKDIPAALRSTGVPVTGDFTFGADFAHILLPEAEIVQYPWILTAMATMSARREPRGYMSMVQMMFAAARVRDKDELLMGAGYFMAGKGGAPVIWRESMRVIIGSASEEQAIQTLAADFRSHLPEAVKAFRDDLYGEFDPTPVATST